ncbi:hypothetical protein D3C78_1164290 [compost metagenome]
MTPRIGFSFLTPLFHRYAVVSAVFAHLDPMGAQAVFLPLPSVRRHVHRGLEAQARTDDTDRQAEVAGRAHGNAVLGKERPCRLAVERGVIITRLQQSTGQREVFRVLKHFIDAATGLDRTGNWQQVVGLEPQGTALGQLMLGAQHSLQRRERQQGRLDDAGAGCGFAKRRLDERCKTLQSLAGLAHILRSQRHITQRFSSRRTVRVEPAGRAQRHQLGDQRVALTPVVHRSLQRHGHTPLASG